MCTGYVLVHLHLIARFGGVILHPTTAFVESTAVTRLSIAVVWNEHRCFRIEVSTSGKFATVEWIIGTGMGSFRCRTIVRVIKCNIPCPACIVAGRIGLRYHTIVHIRRSYLRHLVVGFIFIAGNLFASNLFPITIKRHIHILPSEIVLEINSRNNGVVRCNRGCCSSGYCCRSTTCIRERNICSCPVLKTIPKDLRRSNRWSQ